jgi:hypothetical protein
MRMIFTSSGRGATRCMDEPRRGVVASARRRAEGAVEEDGLAIEYRFSAM